MLISPIHQLKAATDATGRHFGIEYPWDDETLALVAELDFVARDGELAATGASLPTIVGADDDLDGIRHPAEQLHAALPVLDLVVVEGMGHDLAVERVSSPHHSWSGRPRSMRSRSTG